MLVGNYRGGLSLFFGKNEGPVTSIGENNTLTSQVNVLLYPNPANASVTISTNFSGTYAYSVTDMNGRLVIYGNFTGNTQLLDLNALDNGLYVVQVSGQQVQATHKLVKFARR
jgi:hypothetical protein